MFYYLNEPAEGGGTAFPFADNATYDDSVIILSHLSIRSSDIKPFSDKVEGTIETKPFTIETKA